MKKTFLIILTLFVSLISVGQDLTGRWSGEKIQVFSDDETFIWQIEANIIQKRKRITGKIVAVQTGTKNYSVVKFSGSIKNGKVKIDLDEIVKIDFPEPNYEFLCFRNYKGNLIVDVINNSLVIDAETYGIDIKYDLIENRYIEGNCSASTIRLTKKNIESSDQSQEKKISTTSVIENKKEIVLVDEKEIKLFNKNVKIKVWDSYEEDGDLINLYLNGKVLFSDLKVSKKGEKFDIELQSGENIIEVEALNEGTISPNTSAIRIIVNNQEYEIILSAKKGERDSLKIIVD